MPEITPSVIDALGAGLVPRQMRLPFGYRTWWLTQEGHVRKVTPEIIRKNNARYMMRPEFVLNFIALAPSTEAVRISITVPRFLEKKSAVCVR
jgi:hypothetical protein